ncbi:FAD-dependent oxidoreductase [Rhizobium sp. CB3090]|uniref:FAD-dependent oxidoreductase n=1 Tax=Rhizobium sp. CB3090 TaxID=3039156 RepID=UPI0024B0DEB9|nr:FAD-dependent oxidoreductase [Rhizobium sp. CB3090]WFU10326.1 FAD-dependent oxidoreductase [Rhizobium sp. CB3090]
MKITFTKKVHEYDDVYSFFFDAADVSYKAGQYTHLRVGARFDFLGSIREMSFASAPGDSELMFSMHVGSNSKFKEKMSALQPGDTIGLFGTGAHVELPERGTGSLVFIAGGVGMTPFRSMILAAHKTGNHQMTLIQVQRGDFLYRKELEPLVSDYTAVRPEAFADTVKNVAEGRNDSAIFYVCGSKRLIASVVKTLNRAGIEKDRIQIESYK